MGRVAVDFWRWPRREAQCRYPVRSRPSEQRRPTPKSTQPSTARGRRAAGCVARSLQPATGMRLPRSLPSALLPLRAPYPNISTGSSRRLQRIQSRKENFTLGGRSVASAKRLLWHRRCPPRRGDLPFGHELRAEWQSPSKSICDFESHNLRCRARC